MKKLVKFILLISLITTMSGCSSFGVMDIVENTYTKTKDITAYEGNWYYDQLNDHEKAIYCAIAEMAEKSAYTVKLPFMDRDEVERAMKAFVRENPQYYWISEGVTFTVSPGKNITKIEFDNDASAETVAQLESIAREILEESRGENELQTLQNIYANLAEHMVYVADSEYNQDLRSSLINGETVCAGYAKAVQYVLQLAGYKAYYVTGTATQEESVDPHGWTLVNIDEKWYWCDLTWDDRGETGFDYFMVTDDDLLFHHECDDEFFSYPVCESDDYKVFIGQENYFEEFNKEKVEKYIARQIKNGSTNITVKFATDEAYKAAEEYLCDGDGLYILFRNRVSSTAGYNCTIAKSYQSRSLRFQDFKIKR